ncbi:MAG TPA: sigma-70 family RNA polymerase sigma factor [Actinomycetota bacterium]|nr:sigma-70 family RNA polymerase sigma factor [Actinomycetota bacterium]
MDNAQLRQEVRRAARGDEESAALLFDHYHPRLYRYALARVGSSQDAEDVAAETFARVLRDLDRFRWRGAGFDAWLFRIAHNLVMDHFRRSGRESLDEDMDTQELDLRTPEGAFLQDELAREVQDMLSHLTHDQRDVIALRFAGGLDTHETAAALGKKVNAVRQLQFRALETLRKRMAHDVV